MCRAMRAKISSPEYEDGVAIDGALGEVGVTELSTITSTQLLDIEVQVNVPFSAMTFAYIRCARRFRTSRKVLVRHDRPEFSRRRPGRSVELLCRGYEKCYLGFFATTSNPGPNGIHLKRLSRAKTA